jgi:RNA polymerase sigma factor (sigma-70 family)
VLLGWTNRARHFERDALPHLPALYRMARQLVGVEAADDLVQETFLRAWKYFETFDSATNCRAWLFRILRNVWIGRWRKSRLELPFTETGDDQIEPYYDWEDEFLREEMSAEVERALSELPADYRLTILLARRRGAYLPRDRPRNGVSDRDRDVATQSGTQDAGSADSNQWRKQRLQS